MNIEERKASIKDLQGLIILISITNLVIITLAIITGLKVFIVLSVVMLVQALTNFYLYKNARKEINLYLIKEALK